MYPTNKLHPLVRYPLVVVAGFLASLMFLILLIAALKLGEWLLR